MEYAPEYAQGQILVDFINKTTDDFVREFGKGLGYELLDEEYAYDDFYIFKTPIGKEGEAIEILAKYSKFVEHVRRRDLKIERRWNKLEELAVMVENLNDNAELSDEDYNQRLEEIRDYIKS